MRMPLSQLIACWITIFMQGLVMFLVLRRRLRSAFPFFFTFLGLNTVAVLIGMSAYYFAYGQYFYIYWSLSTILMCLGLAVLYESFANILKPYSAVADLGKMLFWWAGLFLLVAAALTAAVTSGPTPKRIVAMVDLCDRCVHLMQCGLLMLLVLFQKRLNLSWRKPGMFVSLGIGVTAALDLIVSYAEGRFPNKGFEFAMAYGISFVVILAFWAFRIMQLQPKTQTSSNPPSLILQRWNESLMSYGYRGPAVATAAGSMESFLPGIEKTVERVLARKAVH
jgi:hypothetical protein